jgi:sporulation protein YlmC with PRC-barrel domain
MANVMFVREFINRGIMNSKGERLGAIKALAVNMDSGMIAYAVLTIGTFPNRTKFFAVPWELLKFSTHDKRFILEIPRELLIKTPGYDTLMQVATKADFHWLGEVYIYYSDTPDWEHKRQAQMEQDLAAAQQRRKEVSKEIV